MSSAQEERRLQLKVENDRRLRRIQDGELQRKQAEENQAKEQLERRRIERQQMDERMRKPWKDPPPPRKEILRKGSKNPPVKVVDSPSQSRPEAERQRREWAEGLKAHINKQRNENQRIDRHQDVVVSPGAPTPPAVNWQQMKDAGGDGLDDLLQEQELESLAEQQQTGGRRRATASPYRTPPRGAMRPGADAVLVTLVAAQPAETPLDYVRPDYKFSDFSGVPGSSTAAAKDAAADTSNHSEMDSGMPHHDGDMQSSVSASIALRRGVTAVARHRPAPAAFDDEGSDVLPSASHVADQDVRPDSEGNDQVSVVRHSSSAAAAAQPQPSSAPHGVVAVPTCHSIAIGDSGSLRSPCDPRSAAQDDCYGSGGRPPTVLAPAVTAGDRAVASSSQAQCGLSAAADACSSPTVGPPHVSVQGTASDVAACSPLGADVASGASQSLPRRLLQPDRCSSDASADSDLVQLSSPPPTMLGSAARFLAGADQHDSRTADAARVVARRPPESIPTPPAVVVVGSGDAASLGEDAALGASSFTMSKLLRGTLSPRSAAAAAKNEALVDLFHAAIDEPQGSPVQDTAAEHLAVSGTDDCVLFQSMPTASNEPSALATAIVDAASMVASLSQPVASSLDAGCLSVGVPRTQLAQREGGQSLSQLARQSRGDASASITLAQPAAVSRTPPVLVARTQGDADAGCAQPPALQLEPLSGGASTPPLEVDRPASPLRPMDLDLATGNGLSTTTFLRNELPTPRFDDGQIPEFTSTFSVFMEANRTVPDLSRHMVSQSVSVMVDQQPPMFPASSARMSVPAAAPAASFRMPSPPPLRATPSFGARPQAQRAPTPPAGSAPAAGAPRRGSLTGQAPILAQPPAAVPASTALDNSLTLAPAAGETQGVEASAATAPAGGAAAAGRAASLAATPRIGGAGVAAAQPQSPPVKDTSTDIFAAPDGGVEDLCDSKSDSLAASFVHLTAMAGDVADSSFSALPVTDSCSLPDVQARAGEGPAAGLVSFEFGAAADRAGALGDCQSPELITAPRPAPAAISSSLNCSVSVHTDTAHVSVHTDTAHVSVHTDAAHMSVHTDTAHLGGLDAHSSTAGQAQHAVPTPDQVNDSMPGNAAEEFAADHASVEASSCADNDDEQEDLDIAVEPDGAAVPSVNGLLQEIQQLSALRKQLAAEFEALGHADVAAGLGTLPVVPTSAAAHMEPLPLVPVTDPLPGAAIAQPDVQRVPRTEAAAPAQLAHTPVSATAAGRQEPGPPAVVHGGHDPAIPVMMWQGPQHHELLLAPPSPPFMSTSLAASQGDIDPSTSTSHHSHRSDSSTDQPGLTHAPYDQAMGVSTSTAASRVPMQHVGPPPAMAPPLLTAPQGSPWLAGSTAAPLVLAANAVAPTSMAAHNDEQQHWYIPAAPANHPASLLQWQPAPAHKPVANSPPLQPAIPTPSSRAAVEAVYAAAAAAAAPPVSTSSGAMVRHMHAQDQLTSGRVAHGVSDLPVSFPPTAHQAQAAASAAAQAHLAPVPGDSGGQLQNGRQRSPGRSPAPQRSPTRLLRRDGSSKARPEAAAATSAGTADSYGARLKQQPAVHTPVSPPAKPNAAPPTEHPLIMEGSYAAAAMAARERASREQADREALKAQLKAARAAARKGAAAGDSTAEQAPSKSAFGSKAPSNIGAYQQSPSSGTAQPQAQRTGKQSKLSPQGSGFTPVSAPVSAVATPAAVRIGAAAALSAPNTPPSYQITSTPPSAVHPAWGTPISVTSQRADDTPSRIPRAPSLGSESRQLAGSTAAAAALRKRHEVPSGNGDLDSDYDFLERDEASSDGSRDDSPPRFDEEEQAGKAGAWLARRPQPLKIPGSGHSTPQAAGARPGPATSHGSSRSSGPPSKLSTPFTKAIQQLMGLPGAAPLEQARQASRFLDSKRDGSERDVRLSQEEEALLQSLRKLDGQMLRRGLAAAGLLQDDGGGGAAAGGMGRGADKDKRGGKKKGVAGGTGGPVNLTNSMQADQLRQSLDALDGRLGQLHRKIQERTESVSAAEQRAAAAKAVPVDRRHQPPPVPVARAPSHVSRTAIPNRAKAQRDQRLADVTKLAGPLPAAAKPSSSSAQGRASPLRHRATNSAPAAPPVRQPSPSDVEVVTATFAGGIPAAPHAAAPPPPPPLLPRARSSHLPSGSSRPPLVPTHPPVTLAPPHPPAMQNAFGLNLPLGSPAGSGTAAPAEQVVYVLQMVNGQPAYVPQYMPVQQQQQQQPMSGQGYMSPQQQQAGAFMFQQHAAGPAAQYMASPQQQQQQMLMMQNQAMAQHAMQMQQMQQQQQQQQFNQPFTSSHPAQQQSSWQLQQQQVYQQHQAQQAFAFAQPQVAAPIPSLYSFHQSDSGPASQAMSAVPSIAATASSTSPAAPMVRQLSSNSDRAGSRGQVDAGGGRAPASSAFMARNGHSNQRGLSGYNDGAAVDVGDSMSHDGGGVIKVHNLNVLFS